jgi:N-acetylglucosaminyl-diphospho-decaprenol L-rhamnosyltransferase
MHIAVAIVSYRSRADVLSCLAALAQSRHTDFEVIICENGGPAAFDDLRAHLPSLPGGQTVRVVLAEGNLGYAGGVNRCMAEAPDADAWWVLNPDTQPDADAMAALAQRLAVGDCEAVGCAVRLDDDSIQSYGGLWRPQFARAVSIGYGSPVVGAIDGRAIEAQQNYINGAAMLVGRRFRDVAGPMREDYFLYCEEVEWCLRAKAAGLRLGFAPDAFVLHHHGTSTGNTTDIRHRSALSVYLDERNKILVTRDCFPALLLPASVGALGLLTLRFGRARAWSQLGEALRGWLAGLRDERGPPARLMRAA